MRSRLLEDLLVWLTKPRLVRGAIKVDMRKIRHLLAAGVEVDIRDRYGRPALMEASRHGHIEVVQELLKQGADPTRRSFSDKTALIYAATPQVQEALSKTPRDTTIHL